MADRTYKSPKILKQRTLTELKKTVLVEATVSTGDTITIDELTTITNVALFNATTGAVVTATTVDNVITITEAALTDEKLSVTAIG